MSEQSLGEGILHRIKGILPNSHADATRNPVTTFKDGQVLHPDPITEPQSAPGDGTGIAQPGELATELHPGDQEAMDAHRAPQVRQSEFAADAAIGGVSLNRVEPPGGYDISGQAGDTPLAEATPAPTTTPIKQG